MCRQQRRHTPNRANLYHTEAHYVSNTWICFTEVTAIQQDSHPHLSFKITIIWIVNFVLHVTYLQFEFDPCICRYQTHQCKSSQVFTLSACDVIAYHVAVHIRSCIYHCKYLSLSFGFHTCVHMHMVIGNTHEHLFKIMMSCLIHASVVVYCACTARVQSSIYDICCIDIVLCY